MLNACVLLKVVPTKAEAILSGVRAIERVRKAYFAYGRFDIAVFVEVENYKELRKITSQINEISGVRSTETLAEA
ncbi:MAG: Lrp/AsnC ligand binding domain-containing protein [Candidatus Bathyarchaeota archaeon]|nr:Lrp/AsnC ligand binding domain-containing protein [Candidatus Bathyarchaeota archaeon]